MDQAKMSREQISGLLWTAGFNNFKIVILNQNEWR